MATTPNPERAAPQEAEPNGAKIAAVSASVFGVGLTLGADVLFGGRTALSVGSGAVIAVANLIALGAILRAMLRPVEGAPESAAEAGTARNAGDPTDEAAPPPVDHVAVGRRGGAAWGAFALVKIIVLFGGIWVLLTRGWADPMPLVVGYGVLPLGIGVSGLFTSLAPRPPRRRSRTE